MKQSYNTALYLRLSRDDENAGESNSIATQRMMLRRYAEQNGLYVVDEYIDDGYSGTNFDRPNFQRMINDIEAGRINCVVTKDLSRLGRNYLLTGQYMELYFPAHGVRYIAIDNGVDSNNQQSAEFTPFLNVINEWYARDISRKVTKAFRTRHENGAHYGAYAPLGYRKDPEQTGHLLVDDETRLTNSINCMTPGPHPYQLPFTKFSLFYFLVACRRFSVCLKAFPFLLVVACCQLLLVDVTPFYLYVALFVAPFSNRPHPYRYQNTRGPGNAPPALFPLCRL